MGGCSYDRDVYSSGESYSSSGFHSSPLADKTFKKSSEKGLDKALLPINRTLECSTKRAIVIALDVTGSMGDSAKVLYDKLPMLWGQLEQQGYLKDFSISFAAVGDSHSDQAPFQICDFETGKKIDSWIERMYLEGGGGGGAKESYEMLAHYYASHVRFTHPKAGEEKPFFFIIGDEAPYDTLAVSDIKRHFGGKTQCDLKTKDVFDDVKNKYNFKHIHVPYGDLGADRLIEHAWKEIIKDDFMKISEPKAVVDLLLGTVAIMEGTRTPQEYEQDMRDRGQTEARIKNVMQSLKDLKLPNGTTNIKLARPSSPKKGRGKTERL